MSEFKHIKEVVCDDNNIEVKSKSKLIYIAVLCVAVALSVLAVQLPVGKMLSCAMFFMAIVVAAIGVVGAAKPGKCIYYTPTGELVKEHVFYFDTSDKKAVTNAVRAGELDLLKLMTSKAQGNMMALVYATASRKYYVSQIHKYVPHEYVPDEEVVIGNISLN